MKNIISIIIGAALVFVFVFGAIKTIYVRNFADPEFTILESKPISSPVKNALFWYEQELEKTAPGMMGAKLSKEESAFIKPLYNELKTAKMVSEQVKTMSETATEKMIEYGAYSGTEPDVWEIAKQNDHPYIFKIEIISATERRKSNELSSITYLFSLHDISNELLIWQAESIRLGGFFTGMSESEKSISTLKKHLKKAKIIE